MSPPHSADTRTQSTRILVADDYQVNRKIARLMLQKAGYEVDVVANGQQAVQACRRNRYDLILMDIKMPLMDGCEATKRIRKWESEEKLKAQSSKPKGNDSRNHSAFSLQPSARAKRLAIIAMTGSVGEGSFDEAQYPGMDDCIGKPVQLVQLLAVVKKWLSANPAPAANKGPAGKSSSPARISGDSQFPLDMDRAIQEFMGKKEILYGVLHEFIMQAKLRIGAIHQAAMGYDYGAVMAEAHGLRGGAGNLRADKLASLAADLEQAADNQQPDLTNELAAELEREFKKLERYSQQFRFRAPPPQSL